MTLALWLPSPSFGVFLAGVIVSRRGLGADVQGRDRHRLRDLRSASTAPKRSLASILAAYLGLAGPVIGLGALTQIASTRVSLLAFAGLLALGILAAAPALLGRHGSAQPRNDSPLDLRRPTCTRRAHDDRARPDRPRHHAHRTRRMGDRRRGWEFGWGPQDDEQSIAAIHRAEGMRDGLGGLRRRRADVGRWMRATWRLSPRGQLVLRRHGNRRPRTARMRGLAVGVAAELGCGSSFATRSTRCVRARRRTCLSSWFRSTSARAIDEDRVQNPRLQQSDRHRPLSYSDADHVGASSLSARGVVRVGYVQTSRPAGPGQ